MKLPWLKKSSAPPPVDVEAIRRAAFDEGAKAGVEIMRSTLANAPMPGIPSPNQQSPYGVYKWNNPIWYTTPQSPTRRPGSILSTQTLRILADTYDVLRACIQHLKREVQAVPLKITAIDASKTNNAQEGRIREAQRFFSMSGGLGGPGKTRTDFEAQCIEDINVLGAAAIYYAPTRGGKPYSVFALDAETIRPRVDSYGFPGEGEDWWEQWILGILTARYTNEELVYSGLPTHSRSYTPFYASPVEWLVNVVNSALKADEWNRSWLTDGSTVSDVYAVPDDWTTDQVRGFQQYWDALLSGNIKDRQKTKFLPSGTTRLNATRKDQDFQEFELWLLRRTCAIMGVQPASVGFSGEQYKVSQEDSMQSTSAFGVGVFLDWRKALYDDLLQRLGFSDLEVHNVTQQEEKATERADRLTSLVAGAILTPNEARAEEGKDPIEGGDTLFVPTTSQPLEIALKPPEPAPAAGGAKSNADTSNSRLDSPPLLDGMVALNAEGQALSRESGHEGGIVLAQEREQARRTALILWERKALRRLKERKSAAAPFQSEAIETEIARLIGEELKEAQTPEDVKAVFAVLLH